MTSIDSSFGAIPMPSAKVCAATYLRGTSAFAIWQAQGGGRPNG